MPENEQSQQIVPKAPFQNTARQRVQGCSSEEVPGSPRCCWRQAEDRRGEAGSGDNGRGRRCGYLQRRHQGHPAVGDALPGAYLALGCPCAAGRPSRTLPLVARRGYRAFLDLLEKRRTLLFRDSQKGHLFSRRQDTTLPPTACVRRLSMPALKRGNNVTL